MLPNAATNAAANGEFTAWGAHPLGWALVAYVEKKSVSLKAETTLIFTLAFAVFKNN